jgi:DNA-binding SARP family transcriptional activator
MLAVTLWEDSAEGTARHTPDMAVSRLRKLLGRRDRLRSRFLRLVAAHGAALERLGRSNQAADGYRRALELEPLAEEIYPCLMRCHLEQDEPAQALETYRRCRQMLSVVLGVSPSPQTEKLAECARRQ